MAWTALRFLIDPSSLEESAALLSLKMAGLRRVLVDVLSTLPDRERDIVVATQVSDPPATLEGLGKTR